MIKSDIKLYIINYRYHLLSTIIINLERHLEEMYKSYIIEYAYKNNILQSILKISKELMSAYNTYIMNEINNTTCPFDDLLKLGDLYPDSSTEQIFNNIKPFIFKYHDSLPLYNLELDLINIIYDIGYNSLKDVINILIFNKFKLSENQLNIINELDNIFIPTQIRVFNVVSTEEYYWRLPLKYNKEDGLELKRELWIKNNNKEYQYFKIEGYFVVDVLSTIYKSSHCNYPLLHKNKNNISILLKEQPVLKSKVFEPINSYFDKFMRYDYLGNIYCYNPKDYVLRLYKMYDEYLELSNTSFVNIIKSGIGANFELNKLYNIIFLLLLGNDNNVNIASILLNLVKENKMSTCHIHNILCSYLPYYLQVKLKKGSDNINDEIDKIKSLTIDDINYKKQVILNKNIPNNVKSMVLEKIEEMKSFNNEYYKQLSYVKYILSFPWNIDNYINNIKPTEYITNIESELEKLSYGHDDAKKALLQMIGKWTTNPSSGGTSFGFVGPPGVGKTLLAKSVSKALKIPFAEITLGGQNDGELLHGHGYTYAGSQPGMIIKKMCEIGNSRCILYFDELDKTCSKHGTNNEITNILIHLTDPNMNKTFQDRFFQGIEFPLDKVIMIFSYNDSSLIDPILLDRLKEIKIDAYTINDKIQIVKQFIIPELVASIGLQNEPWTDISDDLIEYIIDNYTNEAGVRSIKRCIEKIYLTLNLDKICKKNNFEENTIFKISKEVIIKILNTSNNELNLIHSKPEVGIMNGLYATTSGTGGIIPIQIFNNANCNTFEMKYTGKQGDVMKESVQCSFTACIEYFKRTNIIKNIDQYLLENFKYGFHIHTPSTSIPKDGPSAGCGFTSAFISRILNKPIRNDIAMTGEIELTGRITKIGGLNFKLIGAKKAGVKIVYVPEENKKDLDEIKIKYPQLINENFTVKLFNYIDEIIDLILL